MTCCSEHGTRAPEVEDIVDAYTCDYDELGRERRGACAFNPEDLAARPPYRDFLGFDPETLTSLWDEYLPSSPRTGEPTDDYARVWAEWLEGRDGGGLWDHEVAAEMDWRAQQQKRKARRQRQRVAVVGLAPRARVMAVPAAAMVGGRIHVGRFAR